MSSDGSRQSKPAAPLPPAGHRRLRCIAGFYASEFQARRVMAELHGACGLSARQTAIVGPGELGSLRLVWLSRWWIGKRPARVLSFEVMLGLAAAVGGLCLSVLVLRGLVPRFTLQGFAVPGFAMSSSVLLAAALGVVGAAAVALRRRQRRTSRFDASLQRHLGYGRWAVIVSALPSRRQPEVVGRLRRDASAWCAIPQSSGKGHAPVTAQNRLASAGKASKTGMAPERSASLMRMPAGTLDGVAAAGSVLGRGGGLPTLTQARVVRTPQSMRTGDLPRQAATPLTLAAPQGQGPRPAPADTLFLAAPRVSTFYRKDALTNASGFFFRRDGRLYLVTSRHVVIDEKARHFPDRLEIELHLDSTDLTRSTGFSMLLYANGRAAWRQGRDSGGEIDVAVLEINASSLPASAIVHAFTPSHLVQSAEAVQVENSLRVVGFPLGFHDALHHLPVLRHAVMASPYGVRFQGQGFFLTDARTHRGTSGAPVVMRDKAPVAETAALPWKLLGVHSSRMDMGDRDRVLDESLGLNCAWYADILLTLTDEARAAPD